VVDAEHPTVLGQQDVPALAVGVVGDRVEDRDAPKLVVVGVDEDDLVTVAVVGLQHGPPSLGDRSWGNDVDHAVVRIVLDPQLAHALAERPVAQNRGWHKVPAGGGREEVRRHLAACEAAVGEVPQWALTPDRLVDPGDRDAIQADRAVEGRVGRRHQPALDLDPTTLEQLTGVGAVWEEVHVGQSGSGPAFRPNAGSR
jgi:hypothetical protein